MKFFASAPKGTIDLLCEELKGFGATNLRPGGAGVSFEGALEVAYRACLWSRIANRVLLPLTTLKAPDSDTLYEEVKNIRWERHLEADGTIAVDCTSIASPIRHSHYAALKVKDAIVDRMRDKFEQRPSVDLETPDLRINLHLRESQARISIDLSGGSLHRRGYRTAGAAAPLKENLAAAILHLADWPQLAASGAALLDPMCGSATLLIEGALMAGDIAPGLYREHFGFLYWKGHDLELWQRLWQEAIVRRQEGAEKIPPIYGFDHHDSALQAARANIARAELEKHIKIEKASLETFSDWPQHTSGLLVTNPPYGERLGEVEQLRELYSKLGKLLRFDLGGWYGAIFTANAQLASAIGLRSASPIVLYNGPLECRLFRYQPLSDEQGTTVPAQLSDSEGARMFANRLRKNLKHLGKWARKEGIDCYRVYDADLPDYAFAIDIYQGEQLWVHLQEYRAPKTVDSEKSLLRMQEALAVIPQVLEIPPQQLFYKVRQRQKGKAQYERRDKTGLFHQVQEGAARLWVNFTDYLDTGLFLDHRTTRQMIGETATGKHFLNLFAYTGSATVHAALGGAVSTTTVDMSATYLDWAARNMRLNGFTGNSHRFIQSDCLEWLEKAARDRRQHAHYGLIFIDPPTFSNSKRMQGVFDVQRDHVQLISDAMKLLTEDGVLLFSNNFRKFRLDNEGLQEFSIEEISARTLPRDFARNPHIHRCWRIKHR